MSRLAFYSAIESTSPYLDALDEFPLGTLSFSVDMEELAAMTGDAGIMPNVMINIFPPPVKHVLNFEIFVRKKMTSSSIQASFLPVLRNPSTHSLLDLDQRRKAQVLLEGSGLKKRIICFGKLSKSMVRKAGRK